MFRSSHRFSMLGLASAVAIACLGLAVSLSAARPAPVATFSAVAVPPGAVSQSVPVQIVIERWSTDAERDHLFTTLSEQGSDKLLKQLEGMPRLGSIAATGSTGMDLKFARQVQTATGGAHVWILTDRPMSFWERSLLPRSSDYPFTVIQFDIASNGKGKGTAAIATKIQMNPKADTLVIENLGIAPVILSSVERN